MQTRLELIVLAAGLGTRMKSEVPKVLHSVCQEPMLSIVLDKLNKAVEQLKSEKLIEQARLNLVIGHKREQVIQLVESLQKQKRLHLPVIFSVQAQQLGTGHAVAMALQTKPLGKSVLVLNGDLPLLTAKELISFFRSHIQNQSVASVCTMELKDGEQYGRILPLNKNAFRIIEYKDASSAEKKIKIVNGGVYLFDAEFLRGAVKKINTENATGEFYLPDLFGIAFKTKERMFAHRVKDSSILLGVNNMKELAQAQRYLYRRSAEKLMADGIFLHEPRYTYIGRHVKIGVGSTIGPFTSIHGNCVIGKNVHIGAHCLIQDSQIDDKTVIHNSCVINQSVIGKSVSIGPMAHLRLGVKLDDHVRVGNFVEIKKSSLGEGSHAAHLTYVGDAQIGKKVNLGCGFITCNFDGMVRDGQRKHQTIIGDNVFVGSDCQVVAPISIAEGTYIASGSTVTESVSDKDSLVIARSRQTTKPGYAKKYRS